MPQKRSHLTPDQRREVIELTIDTYNKQIEAQRKKINDRRLRNTRMLLENYKDFVAFSDNAVYEARHCTEDVYDILEDLMTGKQLSQEFHVESIKKSAGTTRVIIEHIQMALESYRRYCERSGKEEEMRRYRTVKALFVDEMSPSYQEIADIEEVDLSTVYKDVRDAVKRLTPRFFGVDGVEW